MGRVSASSLKSDTCTRSRVVEVVNLLTSPLDSSLWSLAQVSSSILISREVVPKEYIPGVQKGLEEMMASGILAGFPVVDVKATLYDGSFHDVDSSVLAFQIAARQAFKDGMKKSGPQLLEPIMEVEVICPEDNMGGVIGDLNSRRGMIGTLGDRLGGLKTVAADVPLSEMFQFVSKLRGMTKGRGNYSMKLAKYDVVPQHIVEQVSSEKVAA